MCIACENALRKTTVKSYLSLYTPISKSCHLVGPGHKKSPVISKEGCSDVMFDSFHQDYSIPYSIVCLCILNKPFHTFVYLESVQIIKLSK